MNQATLIKSIQSKSKPIAPIETSLRSKLKQLKPLKSVAFDIYGTLFISASGDISLAQKEDRSTLMKQALEECGVSVLSPEAPLDGFFNELIESDRAAKMKSGTQYPEVEIREIWADFLREAETKGWIKGETEPETIAVSYEILSNPVYPMPELNSTLETLKNKNLPLAIVSNAQFYTQLLFPAFLNNGLDDLGFKKDLRVWSYEELQGKPSTALYEKLAKKYEAYDISPEEVLYVGNDMRNDIAPAQSIGFKTALFAGDDRSLRLRKEDPLCQGVEPDLIIKRLSQILQCLPES